MLGWFKKKFSKKKEQDVEQKPLTETSMPEEKEGIDAEQTGQPGEVESAEPDRHQSRTGEIETAPVEEKPVPFADEPSSIMAGEEDNGETVAKEDEQAGPELVDLAGDGQRQPPQQRDLPEPAPAAENEQQDLAELLAGESEETAKEDFAAGEDEVLDLDGPEAGGGQESRQSQEQALHLDADEVVVEQVISSLVEEREPEVIDQSLEELLADEQPEEEAEAEAAGGAAEELFDQEVFAEESAAEQEEAAAAMAAEEEGTLQSVEELLAEEPVDEVEEAVVEESDQEEPGPPAPASVTAEKPVRKSLFQRLMERLGKTRQGLVYRLDAIFLGKKEIDEDLLDELEEVLITADLGVATTMDLLDTARRQVKRNELSDPQALKKVLRDKILEYLVESDQPAELVMPESGPFVIMVVGVNGVGKTTTIGKIANKFKQSGQSVLLVAADTFRAAAIDQLKIWAERVDADIIAREPGADPSSVVWDGLDYGVKKNFDAIIIDTAGRLHTSVNLMEELKKIRRVMARKLEGAPHEVLLVLDATTGQNGISQAKLFGEAVGVSGLALTKLDGTAKGGIVANVCRELKIPVRFIGIGEQMDDLRDFDPHEFVDALFAEEGGS
jgi:fused signal recognition particle receptor